MKRFWEDPPWGRQLFMVFLILFIFVHSGLTQMESNECETTINGIKVYQACISSSLHLLADDDNFTVSISPMDYTCGRVRQYYCTLGAVRICDYCDGADLSKVHPHQYMYDKRPDNNLPQLTTWWQSITWQNLYPVPLAVNITFSFGKMFELQNDLAITFANSRPQSMVLEKSLDYGQTWEVLQYYEKSCKDMYLTNIPRTVTGADPTAVICTQDYSRETPYQNAQVVFPVLSERLALFLGPGMTNFQNLYIAFNRTQLNRFLSFTDIRIRLLYPQTDGLERLKKDDDLIKYYYAISNIDIIAGCSCNLHAKYCIWKDGRTVCACQHNTDGDNCERCLPLYNQRPWQPGYYLPYPTGTANECLPCNCNQHAASCEYSASLRMGVCTNCTNNTTGVNCELCKTGFFKNMSALATSPYTCIPCNCNPLGVVSNDTRCMPPRGQCTCKQLVQGTNCDECVDQYYGLLQNDTTAGTCKPCGCVQDGTVDFSNTCEKQNGQCPCKPNIEGRICDRCKIGFYQFPTGRPWDDCASCGCDPGGAISPLCSTTNGTCSCRPAVTGGQCTSTLPGYFAAALDAQQYQPTGGQCIMDTAINSVAFPFTGRNFVWCNENQNVQFENIIPTEYKQGDVIVPYRPVVRYSLNYTSPPWPAATLQVTVTGNSGVDILPYQARTNATLFPSCSQVNGQLQSFILANLTAGHGQAWLSPTSMNLDVRCSYSLSLTMSMKGWALQPIAIDSLVMMPDYRQQGRYLNADEVTKGQYDACAGQIALLRSRESAMTNLDCQRLVYSTGTGTYNGGLLCDCDPTGTVGGTQCKALGGQCECKPGIAGRRCDRCAPGYYGFSTNGCQACNCDSNGSLNGVCDYTTGQCPCRPNVAIANANNTLNLLNDRQCRACLADHFGFSTGQGCQACLCSPVGSTSTQCDEEGNCRCKNTIGFPKCDACTPGYFNFSQNGCQLCNCNTSGSVNIACDGITGACNCKTNVQGTKCDVCAPGSFNLQTRNPDGCQRCFCFGHGTTCNSAIGYAARSVTTSNAFSWNRTSLFPLATGSYIKAPLAYLGNQYYSYGKQLIVHIQGVLGQIVLLANEKLAILQGNGEIVYYNGTGLILDGGYQTFDLILHQNYWYYNATTRPDYFRFYAILASLTGVYIQESFMGSVNAIVNNVTLETVGIALPGEPQVQFVENCTCDTLLRNVMGQSCEMCSTGFQRQNTNGTKYETCKQCVCNGRGETDPPQCDENTGLCMNCRNGTVGFNCDQCAPNVTGADCDTCVDLFWGLGKDGCRSCNCSTIGATAELCDKVSGQCTCRPHVVGRTCGECEDNYYSMSATGCIECDSCYGLVNQSVNLLREMRDNLTAYVINLQRNDSNLVMGPFTHRLQNAVTRMGTLIDFLNDANSVEVTVRQQVARLNQTLQGVKESLDIDVPSSVFIINGSLIRADDSLTTAQGVFSDTNVTVVQAYQILQGPLVSSATRVNSLVSSLQAVEQSMTQISGGAVADVNRILQIVNKIEIDANQAQQLAASTYQQTMDSQVLHLNTTLWLRNLEAFEMQVSTLGTEVFLYANNTYNNASDMLDRVKETFLNATTMDVIAVNIRGLESQALQLRAQAEQLANSANTANTVATQGLGQESASAKIKTANLIGQVNALKVNSDNIMTRILAAYASAKNASDQGAKVFSDAENMLRVMQNFQVLAHQVELEANNSIKTVQDVAASSQDAITNALRLQQSLIVSQTSAQAARDIASLAKQEADDKVSFLFPVNEQAVRLEAEASGLLNDVNIKHGNISNINATVIQPARDVCNSLDSDLRNLAVLAMETDSKVLNTTNQVTATQTRITGIQRDLQSIRQLNASDIAALQARVTAVQTDLNGRNLQQTITELKGIADEQRVWLDAMKARKEEIRKTIRRLRDIQEQIRNRV